MTGGLSGEMILASAPFRGDAGTVAAFNPTTGEHLAPPFGLASPADTDQAVTAAVNAFDRFRQTSPAERAELLDAIAREIDTIAGDLVDRAHQETALPEQRLRGEVARTTGQLRMFAAWLRAGDAHAVRIDPADPGREPLARPDLRQQQVPVGPVVVFGASNFPLAFSTAGGDTASALAAGCPVIVKTHLAHVGTAMLVASAVARAVVACELPAGVFSALIGSDPDIGRQLSRRWGSPGLGPGGLPSHASRRIVRCRYPSTRR